jgi:cytidylate kinase
LEALDIELERSGLGFRVKVGGVDPGEDLVSQETSAHVSEVSARPCVRDRVLGLLRGEGRCGGIVCDGRDIGTVVFPEAELKIFLVASAEDRGRRRLLDLGFEATREAVEGEARRLAARDEADSGRAIAPLRQAEDAVRLDTTSLSADEVVGRIVQLARQRTSAVG